jgi:hypothetical protein
MVRTARRLPCDPSPPTSTTIGGVLAAKGHDDEAETYYRTALTLRPGYADAHCNLADLLNKHHALVQLQPGEL